MNDRANWDETWGRVALDMARRSRCDRAKIGAVIVTPDNRVASTGYNGPPAKWIPVGITGFTVTSAGEQTEHCTDWCPRAQGVEEPDGGYRDCPASHAEINALMHSSRADREGGTIYVTGAVCMTCAKAVANSGIETVALVDFDPYGDEHREPGVVNQFLEVCGLTVVYVEIPRG